MAKQSEDEVIARVAASLVRRVVGIGMLALLAVIVLYVAIATPPTFGWQMFLIAMGTGSLMVANIMRVSTRNTLELTRTELRDNEGTVLIRIEEITSIDRGAFAFKPSNGFLLRLKTSQKSDWRPGLWWRASKRIGVGGMTPMRETKFMAEMIALLLAERDNT
ncbi:MAG: hypothetical protein WBV78_17745 [Roseobacter sp.]